LPIQSEYPNNLAYQGRQLFAQLGRKSEFAIDKFRYALTILDVDIKKLMALLHAVGNAAINRLQKAFCLITRIDQTDTSASQMCSRAGRFGLDNCTAWPTDS
jgi:hypothetical protein